MVSKKLPWKVLPAALRHDIDICSGIASELGRESRRLDTHLLHEIHADIIDLAAVTAGVEVGFAVDRQVIGVGAHAIERLIGGAQTGGGGHLVERHHGDARHESREFQIITAVEGEVLHLFESMVVASSPETVFTVSPMTSVTVTVWLMPPTSSLKSAVTRPLSGRS